ncbi:MAG: bis(5'-nucleosyl)-tetraphosphatase (symmetrical) YqeK [Clostridia bacterium]|nr:bis(5'-nucleosyl)-tetraphosphatase (symmetrical) YqeK [Clostridia bacterium]
MQNQDIFDLIKNKYLNNNKEDVLHHVENVADIAVKLAKVYKLDIVKIKLAALLHDISAIMTPQEMYKFAKARGLEIDPAEEKYHSLLHQRVSKIIVQEEYGITDLDILGAVECHTTLKKNSSIYDKIIFIADKISWDTNFSPLFDDLLKSGTIDSLDKACYSYIKYQFENNLLVMPHKWIIDAYTELSNA